jgi:hypothetical protein
MNRRDFLKTAGQVVAAAGIAPSVLAKASGVEPEQQLIVGIDPSCDYPWACRYMLEPEGSHSLDTLHWIGGYSNGDFNDSRNWREGRSPRKGDKLIIQEPQWAEPIVVDA